ncbi:ferredoxin [Clostridium sp. CS001]|uniref:ferredoxin n=1 Tax=Clostridium sp. CS001 TaxID=2880648 RepID=UPI001CF3A820|nr:ferredoxin [Clostridium sp. CS001]MCB2289884.1 ferredoxin [Clostridium sp. CS001]
MKAYVDKDTCIGCGLCPAICPEIFQMEDDGKAVASEEDVAENLMDSARDAEQQCPVDAITIEE